MSKSVPPRLYVLTPVPPAAPASSAGAARTGPAVGIEPVALAPYLDRLAMVTRGPRGELQLSQEHWWGEALKEGLARVLAENLAAMIPSDRVVVFPWRSSWAVQYRVSLHVVRLDGPPGGTVAFTGRWRLLDAGGRELALRPVSLEEPTGDSSYGALATAQSRLLAAVSREIAAEIVGRPR